MENQWTSGDVKFRSGPSAEMGTLYVAASFPWLGRHQGHQPHGRLLRLHKPDKGRESHVSESEGHRKESGDAQEGPQYSGYSGET